ncbi:hypothetical protein M426DRAFT_205727 [Hypoxylon sp. CI-4A]|nr:hypothetical protein M426DRAFT_205727 [Hypoxylon sp. CI-4A]
MQLDPKFSLPYFEEYLARQLPSLVPIRRPYAMPSHSKQNVLKPFIPDFFGPLDSCTKYIYIYIYVCVNVSNVKEKKDDRTDGYYDRGSSSDSDREIYMHFVHLYQSIDPPPLF